MTAVSIAFAKSWSRSISSPQSGRRAPTVHSPFPKLGAVRELIPDGLARPAGQALDVDERCVLLAGNLDLLHELDLIDAGRICREPQVRDGVEELEPNAPPLQDLVKGREDGVAHARLHLVHQVTAEAENEPQ